jgi:hypothetical protein
MKVHLAKKFTNGRITLKVAECGKKAYSRNNQVLMICKTTQFNLSENKCINCKSKAKQQNRLI